MSPEKIERWKALPGFGRYEVSDRGRVRLAVRTHRSPAGRVLKQKLSGGYRRVTLCDDQGRPRGIAVSRLVLMAFVGPPFAPWPHCQAAHEDGDTSNNTPENLRWSTPLENAADALRHGTYRKGVTHPSARFDEAAIVKIRGRRRRGERYRVIAADYGVDLSTIAAICYRKTWKHVA